MFQTGMALFLLRNTKEMFSIIFQGLLFRKMKSMGTKRNNKCTIKIIHWNLSIFTDNFPFWQLFALYQNWVKQSVMKDAQNNVIWYYWWQTWPTLFSQHIWMWIWMTSIYHYFILKSNAIHFLVRKTSPLSNTGLKQDKWWWNLYIFGWTIPLR